MENDKIFLMIVDEIFNSTEVQEAIVDIITTTTTTATITTIPSKKINTRKEILPPPLK